MKPFPTDLTTSSSLSRISWVVSDRCCVLDPFHARNDIINGDHVLEVSFGLSHCAMVLLEKLVWKESN
jgi:hypothetical protein